MPWDGSPSGGFTADGVTPWLPLAASAACNVADQRQDQGSVLALCRSLIALRRAETGGRIAGYELLAEPGDQWAYRSGGLAVVANLSDHSAAVSGPVGEVLLATAGQIPAAGEAITLPPWSGIIARYAGPPPEA